VPALSNDWFNRLWEVPFENFFPVSRSTLSTRIPSIDVTEDKKEINVRAEIPGMSQKDIELTWHDGVLSIRGEKKEETEEKGKNRYFRECSYGSFSRSIEIGKNVNWEEAAAKYKNGVLTVSLPKTVVSQKAIDVKID